MKKITIRWSVSVMLKVLFLCGFFLQLAQCQDPSAVEPVSAVTEANGDSMNNDVSPFLLLGVGNNLYSLPYTWPNAPTATDEKILLHEGSSLFYYITGISYHYRRRLIFWCNSGGTISTGSFENQTKLSNVRHEQVITGGLFDPKVVGDLTVDWINDKLYWTVRDAGRIEELDLETNEKRTILASSGEGTFAFNGLAMYPFPNFGWIYWTDNELGKIERVAVTGEADTRQLILGGLGACVWPVEIDYSEQSVYWVNTCTSVLRSLEFGASDIDQSETRVEIDSTFRGTSSMTIFGDILYWNEGATVKATNKSIENGEVIQIFEASDTISVFSIAVELVHPNKQPTEEEFLEIILPNINKGMLNETCPPCVNGHCIPLDGMCECNPGWTGENCTTDIDECASNISRCDQECHNTIGGFYCSCNSSFYLDSDGRTCFPVEPSETSYTVEPTVSSIGIGPEATPTGDHESTSVQSSSPIQAIHSTTIVSPSTLLPVASSSDFLMVLTSSPTDEIFTSRATATKLSFLLEPSLSSTILLESTQYTSGISSSTVAAADKMLPFSESALETAASLSSTELLKVYKTSTTYLGYSVTEQVAISTPSSPATTTSPTTTTSSTLLSHVLSTSAGSFSTMHISPSSSLMATTREVSPTPYPTSYTLSSSSVPSSSPTPISSSYATQSSLAPSQMIIEPQETSTPTESGQTETDSSTDSLPSATKPPSSDMTLIVIVAAAGGSCAFLIIIVVIMIIAVVHYATKRCGSYTVNPDPSKEKGGTPSWIVNHSGSSKNNINGLSGLSHQTRSSFKTHSSTYSTNSFT